MSTPGKVAFGVFLTIWLQSQMGFFDPMLDAIFDSLVLSDVGWLERLVYPLVRPEDVTATSRAENPIGFGIVMIAPAYLISLIAQTFVACLYYPLKALAASGETASNNEDEPNDGLEVIRSGQAA